MNPHPSLLSCLPAGGTVHTEPLAFVAEVLARSRENGWDLVVAPLDVPMRYVWHWTMRGVPVAERQEVMSCNADEVRLRACLQFCRERCWPIAYDMGRRIHLDVEQAPRVHAAALRGAGAYVPEHIHDHEEIPV